MAKNYVDEKYSKPFAILLMIESKNVNIVVKR